MIYKYYKNIMTMLRELDMSIWSGSLSDMRTHCSTRQVSLVDAPWDLHKQASTARNLLGAPENEGCMYINYVMNLVNLVSLRAITSEASWVSVWGTLRYGAVSPHPPSWGRGEGVKKSLYHSLIMTHVIIVDRICLTQIYEKKRFKTNGPCYA